MSTRPRTPTRSTPTRTSAGPHARAGGRRAPPASPKPRPAADRFADRLAAAVVAQPLASLETYPGETYPPDLAAVAGALAAQGGHDAALHTLVDALASEAVDPRHGPPSTSRSRAPDTARRVAPAPRWPPTSCATPDPTLARALAEAARTHLADHLGPFGGIREVPSRRAAGGGHRQRARDRRPLRLRQRVRVRFGARARRPGVAPGPVPQRPHRGRLVRGLVLERRAPRERPPAHDADRATSFNGGDLHPTVLHPLRVQDPRGPDPAASPRTSPCLPPRTAP